jgi:peptidoglycan/LPS O-acetylase OafA/YrhL
LEDGKRVRLRALDGLRGAAILLVLIWHYFVGLVPTEPGSIAAYMIATLRLTWSGVDLFFVLSGFLIAGILLDNRDAENFFKVFYLRRICRIFPLYFIWLFASVIVITIVGLRGLPWTFGNQFPVVFYATFTQNFPAAWNQSFGSNWLGVTWSLAIEEQFYLLFPFIVRYSRPNHLPWILSGCIVLAPILRSLSPNFMTSYVLAPCRADALLMGALCAWLVRKPVGKWIPQHLNYFYVAFFCLLGGTAALTIKYNIANMPAFGFSLLAALYSCVLLIAINKPQGPLDRILTFPLLGKLGLISYGVYMMHQGMLGLWHEFVLRHIPLMMNLADTAITFLALVFTVGLATVSWRFFEGPIIRLGHKLSYATPDAHVSQGTLKRPDHAVAISLGS